MDSHFDYIIHQDQQLDIKEEVFDHTYSLISPPITPSPPTYTVPCLPSTSRRRGSASSLAGVKRPRPYPQPNRGILTRPMSASPYHSWSSSSSRRHPGERKSSDEGHPAYAIPQQFVNESYLGNIPEASSDLRPLSSSSCLAGAMGDATISSHSRQSHSPVSTHSGHYTGNTQNSDLNPWSHQTHMTNQMSMINNAYPGVAGNGGMGMAFGINDMPLDNYPSSRKSPDSGSSGSPEFHQNYDAYTRAPVNSPQQGMTYVGPIQSYPPSSPSADRRDNDVQRLRSRIQELERDLASSQATMDTMRTSISSSGLPTPPNSAAFQSSWRSRTDARKRIYCSLNRAGNALCAWHDSRRERRAYPPRNAPPGYLNCGCTYEEALFEESLSRHGVGSYLPGETVRMDPALRNPLLKLLQQRYGYKDGDFEHDPLTETWADGEAPSVWEKKAQNGAVIKRRPDGERH